MLLFQGDNIFHPAGSQTTRTSYPQIRTVTPRAERSRSPIPRALGPRPAATSTGVVHLVELEVTRLALAQCDPVQIGADGGLLVTFWSLPLAQAARWNGKTRQWNKTKPPPCQTLRCMHFLFQEAQRTVSKRACVEHTPLRVPFCAAFFNSFPGAGPACYQVYAACHREKANPEEVGCHTQLQRPLQTQPPIGGVLCIFSLKGCSGNQYKPRMHAPALSGKKTCLSPLLPSRLEKRCGM